MTNTIGTRPSVWIITNMCRFGVFFWFGIYSYRIKKTAQVARFCLSVKWCERRSEREKKRGGKGRGKHPASCLKSLKYVVKRKVPFVPLSDAIVISLRPSWQHARGVVRRDDDRRG